MEITDYCIKNVFYDFHIIFKRVITMTFDTSNTEQLRSQQLLIDIHSRLYTNNKVIKNQSVITPVHQQRYVTL